MTWENCAARSTSGCAGSSQVNLDLAKKNRSALSLNSVGGRGVSCLWIRLPVFITSSCAGTEGRHTIPYPGLSVSGAELLQPRHKPASAHRGGKKNKTGKKKQTWLIAPYPTDQWGLSLSENGSAKLCKAVLTYQESCQVITAFPTSKHAGQKINTRISASLHL